MIHNILDDVVLEQDNDWSVTEADATKQNPNEIQKTCISSTLCEIVNYRGKSNVPEPSNEGLILRFGCRSNPKVFLELAFLKASSHYSTKGSSESSVKR